MSQKERELLAQEGVEARIRNKLSPVKNLFSLIKMFAESEDTTRDLSLLSIMEKTKKTVDVSFETMTFIATEKGNYALQEKLKDLKIFIVEANTIVDTHKVAQGKHAAFLFSTQAEAHELLIEEIIRIARDGS